MIDPKTYCKDCKRSVYGEYKDCDISIENDGLYVRGDSECGCKVLTEKDGVEGKQYGYENLS